ncbi:hypothetical protein ES319_D06G060700v1 [Gossypium barbadense]|uniref:Uncharacterized protein n=2 Tax=Gossypium TaxID=3633 RepID=A0A5J5R5B0_GOSBA|nr:hypothetical protein ES319_D06G060700v1 [Gossypium barbadense]TYG63900.1 hypothetical protein ES288_D06G065800v1 [Gossypium darwinii]
MGRKLYDEAVQGNKVSLLNLLLEDALLLDRFILSCYPGIPLQVAVMLGHFYFVDESSPLYIAAAKGYLEVNADMCLVCDLEGRNPLHIAAMKELVHASPWAAQLPNYDRNNIFHIAIAAKQIEAINFLISSSTVDVSCEKEDGFTALYLLSHIQRDVKEEIVESFGRMGATHAKDKPLSNGQLKATRTKILLSTCDQSDSIPKHKKRKDGKRLVKSNADWLERKCDTLMLVASLLAAMAYQGGVNPPSVVWQYNSTDNKID